MNKLIAIFMLFSVLMIVSCKQNDKSAKTINETISPDAFEKQLKTEVQLIDVRTPEEFAQGHLFKAINIDINGNSWKEDIGKLDKGKTTLVYCKSGGRSANAANDLAELGFKTVYNLDGGIIKWMAEHKAIELTEIMNTSKGMSLADFNLLVQNEKYVLVDFHAKWCGPCRKLSPILEKIAKERIKDLVLEKVDADENQNLLVEKGIDGIPYLELYKNGKLVWKHQGFMEEKQLREESGLK